MKTNANDPVSPVTNPNEPYVQCTKRECIAALAMQGMLANPMCNKDGIVVAKYAVACADALITALNEGK